MFHTLFVVCLIGLVAFSTWLSFTRSWGILVSHVVVFGFLLGWWILAIRLNPSGYEGLPQFAGLIFYTLAINTFFLVFTLPALIAGRQHRRCAE